MKNNILVSICSITYNHAPYIRQCLEGMLMQKTNFDFEIIINDDCSTDGTTEIIREYAEKYPDIVKPIYHEENQYQKGVRAMFAKFVFPKAQGKYIALCEGDDYWIDPLKLQKQVDFLENNTDYALVYTNVHFYNQRKDILVKNHLTNISFIPKNFTDHLTHASYIAPCTWVLRKEALLELGSNLFSDGSFVLALEIWRKNKIHFLTESTAVYRILDNSASHQMNLESRFNYLKGVFSIQKLFLTKYKDDVENYIESKNFIYSKMYNALFNISIALNKEDLLNEMKEYFKNKGKIFKYLIIKYRKFGFCTIFRFIYKLKGFYL